MEINKVQWRIIAKGEKLPCDSFLMRKDGTIPSLVSGAGVVVGQDAYYLPVDELRTLPKEENKDERIMKEILEYFQQFDNKELRGVDISDWIAWLEKKLDNKVESKFKVGDWFIKNNGSHINKEYDTCKISKVGNVYYAIESIYGDTGKISFETFDENFHLWKIQDAKDGDVLFTSSTASHETFIFKGIDEKGNAKCYFAYDSEDGFREGKYHFIGRATNCKPATKEQRDQLEKAMVDAGYTFDFEKKELKKIEQKPTWSEEDENVINLILSICDDFKNSFSGHVGAAVEDDIKKIEKWLKSLKDRYTWRPSKEQIAAVKEAACYSSVFSEKTIDNLISLSKQLKKLKGKE